MSGLTIESPLKAVIDFIDILNKLAFPYLIGGSFASSMQGEFRTTNDIDFLCAFDRKKFAEFIDLTSKAFIVDPDLVRESIQNQQSFNIIHEATFLKIDVFTKLSSYEREQLRRAKSFELQEHGIAVKVASPEDIILAKLVWYKKGNFTSERQVRDIEGVIKVQFGNLDMDYIRTWASILDVSELLGRFKL